MGDNSRPLTLAEFIDMRRQMENSLAFYVESAVREFQRQTGTRVESVSIDLLKVEPPLVSVKVEVRL